MARHTNKESSSFTIPIFWLLFPFYWPVVVLNRLVRPFLFIPFLVVDASWYTKLKAFLLLFCGPWLCLKEYEFFFFFTQ